MTKTELLDLLRDLPGDTEICGFNSEFSQEYAPVTAVLIPAGGVIQTEYYKHRAGIRRQPVAKNNIVVLTENGDEPTLIAESASTIWSKP